MEKLTTWSALMASPGLPRDIVERWSNVLGRLATDPDWLAGNRRIGGLPSIRSPEETLRLMREQAELYAALAKRLDLRQ